MNTIVNPRTGEPMRPEASDYVAKLREARIGARQAARSGNPAKAAPARRTVGDITTTIQATYRNEAGR